MQMERKRVGVAILISDNIDFKTNTIVKDKEVDYIMITGAIQQGDITLVNVYAPNIGAAKYVKHILMDVRETSTEIQS